MLFGPGGWAGGYVKSADMSVLRDCLSHSVVFFFYFLPAEADKAIKALNGRYFGGRVVTAEVYDEDKFEANDLTH